MSVGLPRAYPPLERTPDRHEIVAYARATGEETALHLDPVAARAAGYSDVLAPPLFVSVLLHEPLMDVVRDPGLGLDVDRTVVGDQRLDWHGPICARERTVTQATLVSIAPRGRHRVIEVRTTTHVGDELRAEGVWTGIERGPSS